MQFKLFRNCFDTVQAARPTYVEDADGTASEASGRYPLIDRSELIALFRTVLEEKKNDLPAGGRRKVSGGAADISVVKK